MRAGRRACVPAPCGSCRRAYPRARAHRTAGAPGRAQSPFRPGRYALPSSSQVPQKLAVQVTCARAALETLTCARAALETLAIDEERRRAVHVAVRGSFEVLANAFQIRVLSQIIVEALQVQSDLASVLPQLGVVECLLVLYGTRFVLTGFDVRGVVASGSTLLRQASRPSVRGGPRHAGARWRRNAPCWRAWR